jgi:hypothetical protein
MAEVLFSATKEEAAIIDAIVERAVAQWARYGVTLNRTSLLMDIEATHSNGCPLDLQKFLKSDDFTFVHDFGGIACHIDRATGKLGNCFLPRCAK